MLALALIALLQETPEKLVERLAEADLAKRDEAAMRLRDLGDADDLLRAGLLLRAARRLLDTGKPYSVAVDVAKPLPELLASLSGHFAVPITADGTGELRWSGAFESVGLLEALDRICSKAGAVYAIGSGRIVVTPGTPARTVVAYAGPFRIQLVSSSLRFSNDTQKSRCQAGVEIDAVHQSGLFEVVAANFRVPLVEFDTGDLVRIDWKKKDEVERYVPWHERERLVMNLPDAPRTATAIRRLRGSLVLDVPSEHTTWELPKLAAGESIKRDGGVATVDYVNRGTYDKVEVFTFCITVSRPQDDRTPAGGTVALLSKDGVEAPIARGWSPRHRWSSATGSVAVEARFMIPAGAKFEPDRIVLRVAKTWETVEVPFELKDIPLK